MTSRVIVRAAAKEDIRKARKWYQNIAPHLGEDFLATVDDAIMLAAERPLAYQIAQRTFRRMLLHRFPYAPFYHAGQDRIVVIAVLHQARDPQVLERR
jgi:plasmid stabilization system protein ParE